MVGVEPTILQYGSDVPGAPPHFVQSRAEIDPGLSWTPRPPNTQCTTRGSPAFGSRACGGRETGTRSGARRQFGTSGQLCCNWGQLERLFMDRPRIEEDGILLCPACGVGLLHHDRIVTFTRVEDQPAAVSAEYVPDEDTRENSLRPSSLPLPENPSLRRSGVVISGWCEGCENRWSLTLEQHKGATCKTPIRRRERSSWPLIVGSFWL